jgi:Lectin C-type domain
LNWQDARTFCKRRGYHFVATDDATENQWIFEHFDVYLQIDRWFIGATDAASEGEWRLDDASVAVYRQFRSPLEPNGGTGENCAAMGYLGYEADWDDHRCNERFAFVCEASGD